MLRPLVLVAATLVALPVTAQVNGPAPCTDGHATLGGRTYDCNGVDLMAMVPTGVSGPFRTNGMNDIWGWTDPQTGHEYALAGTLSGTVFVDVTDPANPAVLGKLTTQSGNSDWRDIKVYQNYAFVVSEAPGHGMQVFDLTHLRGLTASDTRDFTADAVYSRIGSAHNIVIDEETGFAYAVGFRPRGTGLPTSCNVPGMMAIDIHNPLTPTFAGCFSDFNQDVSPVTAQGYTHDAQCLVYHGPDADYTGRELCFASNEDVVTVFDVTDKSNVSIITQAEYPGDVYTHQGWFTEDQRYFLVDDEEDEYTGSIPFQRTMVFDMQDLNAPELAFIYTSTLTTIDHNLYIKGRYAFESNYQSGLHILDVGSVGQGQMAEVAFFDTYPQGQAAALQRAVVQLPVLRLGDRRRDGHRERAIRAAPDDVDTGRGRGCRGAGRGRRARRGVAEPGHE